MNKIIYADISLFSPYLIKLKHLKIYTTRTEITYLFPFFLYIFSFIWCLLIFAKKFLRKFNLDVSVKRKRRKIDLLNSANLSVFDSMILYFFFLLYHCLVLLIFALVSQASILASFVCRWRDTSFISFSPHQHISWNETNLKFCTKVLQLDAKIAVVKNLVSVEEVISLKSFIYR